MLNADCIQYIFERVDNYKFVARLCSVSKDFYHAFEAIKFADSTDLKHNVNKMLCVSVNNKCITKHGELYIELNDLYFLDSYAACVLVDVPIETSKLFKIFVQKFATTISSKLTITDANCLWITLLPKCKINNNMNRWNQMALQSQISINKWDFIDTIESTRVEGNAIISLSYHDGNIFVDAHEIFYKINKLNCMAN